MACPLVPIVPPVFCKAPAPLPGVSVSVPVPPCVMVPFELSRTAGASVRSVLFVWMTPPFELSSVPETASVVGPLCHCEMWPPWFFRFAAVNAS
ncbi:hypothetical protein X962_5989 [Burkholderia pseudomallei MSHR7343]|nr:hypothetical protein X962_5989 [Burkholderia pseudomallei MSHR7343]